MSDIAALVLAAGEASRYGAAKQVLLFQGTSLLRRTAQSVLAAHLSPAVVVLGARSAAVAPELDGLGVEIVVNESWQRGIGSSIRCGVAGINAGASQALIITLCDQPLITPESLRRLVTAYERTNQPICVSTYAGTFGPPVLVARRYFADLLQLEDVEGAKKLWATHHADVCEVHCPEGAADVDTPEDFVRWCSG